MQRKIKVLQFPIASSKGGITGYALNIWKNINKDRFQFDFATMSKSLDFADELTKSGCKIYYISCYAEDNKEQFINEFKNILAEGDYDIVHLHTKQWKSILAEQAAKELGIKKIIVHAHSTGVDALDEEKRNIEIRLHNQVFEQLTEDVATDYWACSKLAADFLFGNKIPYTEIKIMPALIDLERYKFDLEIRNIYRRKYGLEDCFVIGHVGRFEYQKNHEFLIKVFSEVSKLVCSAKLLLLGTGKLMPEIKAQVEKLDIKDKVIFLGRLEGVCDWWYQVMDTFCLPSRFEGQPAVLIEAQTSYLPCIYSDSITSEATINDNVSRIPLDVDIWKEKLIELSKKENTEVRERYKDDSLKAVQNKGYNTKSGIRRIEKEYLGGIL